jgi:hypothetical protein
MRTLIVNCFDTYEDRIDLLYNFFRDKGHDVTVIQSDFRHFKKIHRNEKKEGYVFVKSMPYYKNISINRIVSHYSFAKEAFNLVEKLNPDLLYVIVPPNSLARFAAQYKKKNKNKKLIFDLIDLWPETMPIGKIKNHPPFTSWRLLRDNNLMYADYVITECSLYEKILGEILKEIKTETVHLAKKDIDVISKPLLSTEEIHLCYLGSINNIIDISKIKAIVKSINDIKPTTLHIVGDGESKEFLITEVENAGVQVSYHGKIYDPQKKQHIFDRCHFGINIMKESVCVGLTMKSIDYFQYGLPIINNIQADTFEFVERYNIGYNLNNDNHLSIAKDIGNLSLIELMNMRKRTKIFFNEYFSKDIFENKIDNILKRIDIRE